MLTNTTGAKLIPKTNLVYKYKAFIACNMYSEDLYIKVPSEDNTLYFVVK